MACGGRGCPDCNDTGDWYVTGCPLGLIESGAWDFLEAAEMARRGLMPVAGGLLDQAASFVRGCRFAWSEERAAKARRGDLDPSEEN